MSQSFSPEQPRLRAPKNTKGRAKGTWPSARPFPHTPDPKAFIALLGGAAAWHAHARALVPCRWSHFPIAWGTRAAKVINLMDALRRSVETERSGSAKRPAPAAKARGGESERPKKKKSR
jgi:hypothetical protein